MLSAIALINSCLSDSISATSGFIMAIRVWHKTCFSSVSMLASSFVMQTSSTRCASTAAGTAGTD